MSIYLVLLTFNTGPNYFMTYERISVLLLMVFTFSYRKLTSLA